MEGPALLQQIKSPNVSSWPLFTMALTLVTSCTSASSSGSSHSAHKRSLMRRGGCASAMRPDARRTPRRLCSRRTRAASGTVQLNFFCPWGVAWQSVGACAFGFKRALVFGPWGSSGRSSSAWSHVQLRHRCLPPRPLRQEVPARRLERGKEPEPLPGRAPGLAGPEEPSGLCGAPRRRRLHGPDPALPHHRDPVLPQGRRLEDGLHHEPAPQGGAHQVRRRDVRHVSRGPAAIFHRMLGCDKAWR
mmetsp:Transcript_1364/g.4643  ORF Transcript_1364/g.4643 Transcript_1364/m.4643 type:complete len:246 (+) Transcript_1364:94-831(+)